MTLVGMNGSTGSSVTPSLTVPTVIDGDNGLALFHLNAAATVTPFTPPPGWTVIGALGPLGGNNAQSYLCSKDNPFTAADSLSEVDASTTGTTPRWATVLAVYRNAVMGIAPVGMSDNTLDATLVFSASYMPDADSELAILLAGLTTVSNGGPYTVTPPAGGWVEVVDRNLGSTTLSNVGAWGGTNALGPGTGGVNQTIPNGAIATGAPTVRMNAWVVTLRDQAPTAIPPVRYRKTASGVTSMTTYRRR